MADLRDASTDVVYRPLSGLALAGFAVSCLFGGVVALNALLAIVKGDPFFFPTWVLLLAVTAFVLSWVGLNDIRNSEGTKAGQKLATLGMWISLVMGVGYFAYSYSTGLALSQQTQRFFMDYDLESGFFPHLQKAGQDKVELNRAFLLTLPAPDRAGVRPEDEEAMLRRFDQPTQDGSPGPLTVFRTHQIVVGVVKGGADAQIEPLGVQSWKYEKRSYHVACLFRLKIPEANADVVITAKSSEGEQEGQTRKWFVDIVGAQHTALELTPLGEGLKRLRADATQYLSTWEDALRTRGPWFDLAKLDGTDWNRIEPSMREDLKKRMEGIFTGKVRDRSWNIKFNMDPGAMTDWGRDDKGRVWLAMPISVMLPSGQEMSPSGLEGVALIQTAAPVNPEQVGQSDGALPDWEVKQIKFTRYRAGKRM